MRRMDRRAYQMRAVARCMKVKPGQRLLLVAPTGSGKTAGIAVQVIKRHLRKGRRILFLAHKRTIIGQAYDQLIDAGLKPERVGVLMASDAQVRGGRDRIRPDAPVQVAGVLTAVKRELQRFDVVIVDEAHHAAADTYQHLLEMYPKASVLGLTATPARLDGKGLRDCFDELYIVATPAELIRLKALTEPVIYSVPSELRDKRMRRVRTAGSDYAKGELGRAMNHRQLVGNIVTEWNRLAKNRATVVFASSVRHARAIVDRFKSEGVSAELILQKTNQNGRVAILARLKSGKTKIVVNYDVLGEGWHQPSVKCAVLARPTKSLVVYLQQAGRILSPHKGRRPLILDHAANHIRFGLPHDDRAWTLDGVQKGGGEAPCKVCGNGHVCHAGVLRCPECGFKFPPRPETPEEIEARLVRVERDRLLRQILNKPGFAHGRKWAERVAGIVAQGRAL